MWHKIKITPNDKSIIGKTLRVVIKFSESNFLFINNPVVVKEINENFILGSNFENQDFMGQYLISLEKYDMFWEIYEN